MIFHPIFPWNRSLNEWMLCKLVPKASPQKGAYRKEKRRKEMVPLWTTFFTCQSKDCTLYEDPKYPLVPPCFLNWNPNFLRASLTKLPMGIKKTFHYIVNSQEFIFPTVINTTSKNTRLDKGGLTPLGKLSYDVILNTLAKTPGTGTNSLLEWLPEDWWKQWSMMSDIEMSELPWLVVEKGTKWLRTPA